MSNAMSREKRLTNREPIRQFWHLRLERLKTILEKNNFEAHVVDSGLEAKNLVIKDIIAAAGAESISWGGSMTMEEIGLGEALRQKTDLTRIDPMEGLMSIENLRKSLQVDLFLASANAITEAGQLVNLDMLGNRISAITFGPPHVVILAGRNKIVADLEAAMARIRNYVSPAHVRRINAMGMKMDTPCLKTGSCHNCKSPGRICNAWSIIEKSYPKGRIKVILINEDLGI